MAHPVPSAKTALKAILTARGAWAAVDIRDDAPTEISDITRDAFWFNDTEIPQDAWSSLGAATRRVTFRLGFTVAIIREGDASRTTEDAAWTLYEDLMAAIKANPTLSQTVQMVEDITGRETNDLAPNGWVAAFTGSIGCLSKAY